MSASARTALSYAIIIALGGFVFGYDASVISGVVGFVSKEFALSPVEEGLVVSAPTFAAFIAAFTVTPIADVIGRKKMLIALAFLYLLSAIASAFAPSYMALVIARVIGGYAFGSLMLAPIYIAETSPEKSRGMMVSVNQLNIVVGLSAAYFMNYWLLGLSTSDAAWVQSYNLGENVWRYMLGAEAIPALAWFVLLFTLPESPRWLVMQNREDEARTIMAKIIDPDTIDEAVNAIKETVGKTSESLGNHIGGLFAPKMRFIILIGILMAVVQQATGINAVFFYAPTIFEQMGSGTDTAFMQAALIGVINVVFTVVAMVLIDRLGRKPLMMIGLTGVTLSLLTTAYSFGQATFSLSEEDAKTVATTYESAGLTALSGKVYHSDVEFKAAVRDIMGAEEMKKAEADIMNRAININATLVLAGILVFVASFAISLGPVMWVMLSEIFPNSLRAVAMALAGAFNSGTSFLVQFLFPLGLGNWGAASMFTIYGMFAVLGLFLVVKYLPETKGKSLEELEDILVNNRG